MLKKYKPWKVYFKYPWWGLKMLKSKKSTQKVQNTYSSFGLNFLSLKKVQFKYTKSTL